MSNPFWAHIREQLAELRTARTSDDVIRILAPERNPYGNTEMIAGDGFFAGSGGDETVSDALGDAGWVTVWANAAYWYAMRAPDGSVITYCEGDVYRGDRRN